MNFKFCELYPASGVKDAVLVPSFLDGTDALIVAHGNRLAVYPVEDGFLSEKPQFYPIFGTISKLAAIGTAHSLVSTVLVVLDDLRTCVLSFSETDRNLITLSSGNLTPAADSEIPEIRFASHPTVLVAQIGYKTLNVFPISTNSSLEAPFPIRIGCKDIIDFAFVGPVSKVTRLAILTREFDHTAVLRVIDIEPSDRAFNEDVGSRVSVPNDTRSIIAFEPDSQSIVIAFSGQKAIRVAYNVGLTPQVTTATIRTPSPLLKMAAMDPNFYVAIEEGSLELRVAKIEEKGTVHFINVEVAPLPTALVPVTSTLAFVGSAKQDSVLFAIHQDSPDQMASLLMKIAATGSVKRFLKDEESLITVFDRAIAETKEMITFNFSMKMKCKDCVKHWSFLFNENPHILLTNGEESFVIESKDVIEYEEVRDPVFVLDQPTLLFAVVDDKYLQVVHDKIRLFSKERVLVDVEINGLITAGYADRVLIVAMSDSYRIYRVDTDIVVLREEKVDGVLSSVAVCSKYFAVATATSVVISSLQTYSKIQEFCCGNGFVVGMEFDDLSALLVVKSSGNVFKLSEDRILEIPCEGDHCGISKVNDMCIITGSIPHVIRNDKAIPVRATNWLSVVELDEMICALGNEFMWIGQFGATEFCNRTYTSEMSFVGVHKLGEYWFTARVPHCGGQVSLFMSRDLFDTRPLSAFFTFGEGETFTNFASQGENLFACGSLSVVRFIVRNGEPVQAGTNAFSFPVCGFGNFNHYFYFWYQTEIDFCTIDTASETSCDIYKWFSIENHAPIISFDISNRLAVVVGPERALSVYSFDEFRENFIPIASYRPSLERICCACVRDSSIVIGTKNSNVLVLEMKSDDSTGSVELQVVDTFSVGDSITAMAGVDDNLYIGTELGSVSCVTPITPTRRFIELYKVLAQRVHSIGRFCKTLQRSARLGKYYTSKNEICDIETLKVFKEKSQSEQEQLVGMVPNMSLSEAIELIGTVL